MLSLQVLPPKPDKTLAVLLNPAETVQLSVSHNLADNIDLTWTSAAESVATVDAAGQVTAAGKGLAIIKGELGGESYQIYVRVNV